MKLSQEQKLQIIRVLSKTDRKIVGLSTETRISDFGNNEFKELEVHLQRWSKFLGVKEPLDSEIAPMLVIFLNEQFGSLSVKEITNAIMLGLKGELDNVNMTHYDVFSSVYLSQILKAYLKKRKKALYIYKDECHKYIKELQKPTELEKVQAIARAIRETLFAQQSRFYELGDDWSGEPLKDKGICITYDYLVKNTLMDAFSKEGVVVNDEKIKHMENVFKIAKENNIDFAKAISMKIRKRYEEKNI